MWQVFKNSQGSVILRGKLRDTTTGNGKTGLSSASTGLIISTIADNESTPTVYTVAGSTIESITTLGTYAAPTATKCRFKKVDDTNHPGIVELQIADARYAVANAKSLLVSVSGVSGMFDMDGLVPLWVSDPYTAPLTAAQIATSVWQDTTAGDFTVALSVGKSLMNGVTLGTGLTINAYTGNTVQTGDSYARIGAAGAGLTALGDTRIANLDTTVSSRMATYTQPSGFLAATFPSGTVANTTNITAGVITTVTTLTNLPSIPANWITAAGINAAALNGKGDWLLASSYTAPPSTATIVAAVWQDTTAGHFTAANSIGLSIMNGVTLGNPLLINECLFVDSTQIANTLGTGAIGNSTFSAGAINRAALGADTGLQPIRSNTCQAGSTSTTIKLDAGASAVNNFYDDAIVKLTGGTGAIQYAIMTPGTYSGTTKTGTISPAWRVTPDGTTTFALMSGGISDAYLQTGMTFPTFFSSLSIDATGYVHLQLTPGNAQVSANVVQWNSTNVPPENVPGVPITDPNYWKGGVVPAVSVTGVPKVDLQDIAGAALNSTTAQLGVNLVTIKGQTITAAAGVTFPTSIASPTNITAGTITVVGSVTGAVGSVTGNVGGVAGVTFPTYPSSGFKKNQAATISFPMVDANNVPLTGLTVTATRSIDGGTFAACTNAVTEIGTGGYTLNLSAADMNASNVVLVKLAAATAQTQWMVLETTP